MSVGIDVSGRIIVLDELQAELVTGGVPLPKGLSIASPPVAHDPSAPLPSADEPRPWPNGSFLFTYDDGMQPIDMPPGAAAIVAAYTPGP